MQALTRLNPTDPVRFDGMNTILGEIEGRDEDLLNKINDCLKKVIYVEENSWTQWAQETGIYKCTKWNAASIPSDLPDGQGTVITINHAGDYANGWIKQFFISPHTKKLYSCVIINGNHSGWEEEVKEEKVPITHDMIKSEWRRSSGDIYIYKHGSICTLNINLSSGISSTSTTVFNIPHGFRPTRENVVKTGFTGWGAIPVPLLVKTDGNIELAGEADANRLDINISWSVE